MVGALLEVEMSKKCTPLWREAHFEVKMLKTLGLGCSFACLKIFPHFLGCIWRWGFAAAGGWGSLPLAAAAGELPALRGRGQVPEQKFRQGLMWNGGVSAEDSWSAQDMVFFVCS